MTLALLCLGPAGAQDKPKKGQPQMRTLTGIVISADGKPVPRATVLLENTKTKQIVSFYSQPDGSYFFHELSPDVDYKVSARLEDDVSSPHTLSSFDSKRETVINLKLDKKKDK
ncbi:MAG TPA: carboxypeptidase-like regulatory domain-containing protein [Verrucomicrobiae bacterium]|nr:carboxypeptidase-like regulatory domain-containing protein [Verrucomicrobiae bacterium]